MLRLLVGFVATLIAMASAPAEAGFDRWSAETKYDPFTKGEQVTVSYMDSMRSGAAIICDAASSEVMIRVVPGYAFEQVMIDDTPKMAVAFDDVIMDLGTGEATSVGDNFAAVQVKVDLFTANRFSRLFRDAKRQIAFKDGMSERPMIMTARGSGRAGNDLARCIQER